MWAFRNYSFKYSLNVLKETSGKAQITRKIENHYRKGIFLIFDSRDTIKDCCEEVFHTIFHKIDLIHTYASVLDQSRARSAV